MKNSIKLTILAEKDIVIFTCHKETVYIQDYKSLEKIFYTEENKNIFIYDEYGGLYQNRLSQMLKCIRNADNFNLIKIKISFQYKHLWE